MNKIEVGILMESHNNPAGVMTFLAHLTQRGHTVSSLEELESMYINVLSSEQKSAGAISKLPHGTIKRFTPITIAIVGASRRFLAQARTNQVGFNYVSASLQYSDYSDVQDDMFVVPYEIAKHDTDAIIRGEVFGNCSMTDEYLKSCRTSMDAYRFIASKVGNDAAGYAAPQGLRNILIMQGNHEAWMNFIRLRACSRNTTETQYVTMLIWEALMKSQDGDKMFSMAGPDCAYGKCREGKMSCGNPITCVNPTEYIRDTWPLIRR